VSERHLVLAELRDVLGRIGPAEADFVTFTGSGEPTLHSGLGVMLREARALTVLPIAVLTNGSLLGDATVREELSVADVVMPTVSAGSETVWMRLHRPARGLTFASFVEGLVAFRDAYEGRLAAEVMVVEGMNDGDAELAELVALLRRVAPDEIQA
jgi:wyosine [tRNA(Phe)-imidazoG37] synthetase (radical SAM superfamily)